MCHASRGFSPPTKTPTLSQPWSALFYRPNHIVPSLSCSSSEAYPTTPVYHGIPICPLAGAQWHLLQTCEEYRGTFPKSCFAAHFMFPYGPFNPVVPSGPVLRRYDRSPPHASLSQPVRPPANYGPPSQDVELVLRQEPKEALVTTEGKEKGENPFTPLPSSLRKSDSLTFPSSKACRSATHHPTQG